MVLPHEPRYEIDPTVLILKWLSYKRMDNKDLLSMRKRFCRHLNFDTTSNLVTNNQVTFTSRNLLWYSPRP